jgi:hypothetical protein
MAREGNFNNSELIYLGNHTSKTIKEKLKQ